MGDTFVSVRPHTIELMTHDPGRNHNLAQGTVTRAIYLGAHRDYNIALPAGMAVRVLAPEHIAFSEGESVWLHFPPEACRALAS
jgi:iron(III) transport system ATP-binding protein